MPDAMGGLRGYGLAATAKRALDLMVAVPLALVATPLVLLLALSVILSDGGAGFFRQRRVGRSGREFTILKLRTMAVDAGNEWCRIDDPRVTRVGAFLRRTHLDELPQLLNVVRGDMSLVGPRPEQAALVASLEGAIPGYGRRHAVRPGITGWAQVRCGNAGSIDGAARKLEHDLFYVERWSLALDARIVLRTPGVVFRDWRSAQPLDPVPLPDAEPVHAEPRPESLAA
jgi:lipopolysaccharide/colanic/teichoic acid biosynthesis glycosyltransferase